MRKGKTRLRKRSCDLLKSSYVTGLRRHDGNAYLKLHKKLRRPRTYDCRDYNGHDEEPGSRQISIS